MATLKALKGRIGSVKSTQKITRAKKMVAAAKLRKAQAAAEAARPYVERLQTVVGTLAAATTISDQTPKLLGGTGKDQVHLLVVANSDRGLAGAFNSNIVKAARLKADALIAEGKTVRFLLVGRKGRAVLQRSYPGLILGQYDTMGTKSVSYDQAREIADLVFQRFEAGEFDVAHLFYSRFKSALSQVPERVQLIPVEVPADAPPGNKTPYDYEPDEEGILADLLPRNVTVQIYKALLENAASEQGASMTAMDNATRNAGELIGKLTIQYNRTRQAAITKELIEIISGAEAL